MSRKLDVVTLTGEEYDDLMECKEVVTSLLAQLSAAKDRIAELTPVAGTDWRETMQRMLTRMNEACRWPAICDEARAVLSSANEATREPAAYLWGGCLWRTDEMGRGRPGAVELYRAQTPLTDADITALLPIWQQGAWTLPDYGRWVARAVERAHGIKTTPNLCRLCGHSIDAHDKQYGCAEDGCECETPGQINRCVEQNKYLESTISRLREYATHMSWCDVVTWINDRNCDCGYDELMKELEESK